MVVLAVIFMLYSCSTIGIHDFLVPLWNVFAVEVIPPQIEKAEADNFTPGRNLPQCCVLTTCTGEASTVGALRHVLKFTGTRKPKSYLLFRGK